MVAIALDHNPSFHLAATEYKGGVLMVQMVEGPASADVALPSAEELYLRYSQQIYLYLLHWLNDVELAEDLTQETFCRACKALPHLQKPLQASAWLYRIATNVTYDALRQRNKVMWYSLDSWEEEREATYPDVKTIDPEEEVIEAMRIQVALDQLPVGYRQALFLNVSKGYNGEQIAQALGMALSGGKMYLARARRRFRQQYQAFGLDGGE